MTVKNKYANRSKISEAKFRGLVKLFALNLEATQIAELTGLNRNTVNRFLRAIRERLAEFCEQQSPFFKSMNLSSVHVELKVNVAEALMAKQLFSVYSNVTAKSTPKL